MICGAIICRNEADRYLKRTLENVTSLCDTFVVVDDGSTDGTVELCESFKPERLITLESIEGFWGKDEASPRKTLWDLAAVTVGADGWIYFSDSDHELLGCDRQTMKSLAASENVNAWSWPLYDCWESEDLMRVDGWWIGHDHPRPWMVRAFPSADFKATWGRTDIHVGHIPQNFPLRAGIAPGGIRHLGYIKREHREEKARKYLAVRA